jgi:carbon storage regulator
MLVLGRKVDESIMIGDDIVITVLSIEADRVKLGIRAPQHTSILRHELYEIVKQENLRAAQAAASAERDKWLPSLRGAFRNREDEESPDTQK